MNQKQINEIVFKELKIQYSAYPNFCSELLDL